MKTRFTSKFTSKIMFFGFVLSLISISSNTVATIYYVSTAPGSSDSNNGKSVSSAWRNIQFAVNYNGLVAGDIIQIKGGTYFEYVNMQKSGNATGRITVMNYPGETPVIDGTSISIPTATNTMALFEVKASYVTIDGLKVINSVLYNGVRRDKLSWDQRGGSAGICVFGPNVHHVTIRNCYIENTLSSGISVWGNTTAIGDYSGASNIIIENNELANVVVNGWHEHITVAKGVDTYIVRNNIIHDGGHIGCAAIDSKESIRNGKIYGNKIYNTVSNGLYVDAWNGEANNIELFNNEIHNVYYALTIGTEEGGTVHNIKYYNNLVYDCLRAGVAINTHPLKGGTIYNIDIYNNSFYRNNRAGWITNTVGTWSAINIKNNIFANSPWTKSIWVQPYERAIVGVTIDKNLFFSNTAMVSDETMGTNAITTDPKFVSTTNGSYNFHLQSTSPAIDVATSTLVSATDFDGFVRPAGGAFDIGAFEYGATTTVAVKVILPSNTLKLYPNPLSGQSLSIVGVKGSKGISIFNMAGELVFTKKLEGLEIETIGLSNKVSKGSYVVRIFAETGDVAKLLIVQ